MRILNLFSGIGGNRRDWDRSHSVTSVELNPEIAHVYSSFFPDDELVVGDAHQYLLDHFNEFDFIWSSPPCPTHTSFRHNICCQFRGTKPVYPDMMLYQEIIFLKHNFKGGYVVENVVPYYEPLIPAQKIQRHLFWSNFTIPQIHIESENQRAAQIPELQKLHNVDLSGFKLSNKRQVLRNCIKSELGNHILESFINKDNWNGKLKLF